MEQMIVLGWIVIAGFTALAANAKNRSSFEGFVVGVFFPVIGLIGYLLAKPSAEKPKTIKNGLLVNEVGERTCPACSELVKMQALKCRHCSADLVPITETEARLAHESVYGPMRRRRLMLVIFAALALVIFLYFK